MVVLVTITEMMDDDTSRLGFWLNSFNSEKC